MRLALMDADVIAYEAARPAVLDWEDGDEPMVDMDKARRGVDSIVENWLMGARCDQEVLCFSDRSAPDATFRYKVHPRYKAQRDPNSRPVNYSPVVEYMKFKYDYEEWASLEGDDVMGIMATAPSAHKRCIVSIDKDMQTVPGWWFNPRKHKKPVRVRPVDADKFWMFQTLTGDSVDNYLGCPGVGPKKADQVLNGLSDLEEMWNTVVDLYFDQFGKERWQEKFIHDDPEAEAIMNARCARILRHGDYEKHTGKVHLWTP